LYGNGIVLALSYAVREVADTTWQIDMKYMKGGDSIMMKAMFAMLALVLGLTFSATTFVQADEKKAAPAAEKKEEKKAEKKEKK
jgi:hypothetical protein